MKKLISLVCACMISCGLYAATINGHIKLYWDYPANELTNVTFNVYSTTNIALPLTNWLVMTNVNSTNVVLDITPGQRYFYATATNFWGESDPSTVASVPATPKSGTNLVIVKLP